MSIIETQFIELSKKYSCLRIESQSDGSKKIWGMLGFKTHILELTIQDAFQIEIIVPVNYPSILPKSFETENRIPQDFHHNPDRSLCLATNLELTICFNAMPNLIGYVENCLIPYLASFHYWQKNNIMSYSERKHGAEGILETYQEFLEIDDKLLILGLLKLLVEENYRGHSLCICNSGKKIRNCHGKNIERILGVLSYDALFLDYFLIFDFILDNVNLKDIPRNFLIEPIIKSLDLIQKDRRNKNNKHMPPFL